MKCFANQPFYPTFYNKLQLASAYRAGQTAPCQPNYLQTFSKSIKEVEWTTNVNYLQAKNIPVRSKISAQGENRNDVYIPRHRFNDYYFNSNFNPREILDLIQEATNNNRKIKDQTIKEKTDFFFNDKIDLW